MKLNVLFFIFCFPLKILADDCQIWFENEEINGENCLIDCSVAKTDMKTFHCPQQCDVLCKTSIKKKFLFRSSEESNEIILL